MSETTAATMDDKGLKNVMVAIDESDCSRYALSWAIRNLLYPGSRVIVFTAQPLLEFTADLVGDLQENLKRASLALLREAKDFCSQHGIVAEGLTEAGEPKKAICEVVKKHNIELLVMGSHGRGAIKRALIGSVSNYCIHNAECPVLVVRKPT